jgi:transposase InsO family protein
MRYAQGGGLTAADRSRRERVRLAAVQRFEQRAPAADIAAELRVTERSVRRWRQAWLAGGAAGLASRGQAARCALDEAQLAGLEAVLDAGPLAAGFGDQRWTLALKELGIRQSVGRTGICYDNALSESVNASLKVELVHRKVYVSRKKAREDIARWIELRYNRTRLHSGLGYRTPQEVLDEYLNGRAAA